MTLVTDLAAKIDSFGNGHNTAMRQNADEIERTLRESPMVYVSTLLRYEERLLALEELVAEIQSDVAQINDPLGH